jgi:hypothetical protein
MSATSARGAQLISSDLQTTKQLLRTLRSPHEWYESVAERIEIADEELVRHVDISLRNDRIGHAAETDGLYLVALKPRKGAIQHLEVGRDQGNLHVLNHKEHDRLARMLIAYRFLSLVESFKTPKQAGRLATAPIADILQKLMSVPSLSADDARGVTDELFENGWLAGFPHKTSKRTRVLMSRLFQLTTELSERYYKIIRISDPHTRRVSYSYRQEMETRIAGNLLVRALRAGFRAPSGSFLIHAPLARLTDHYEMTMEAIPGYYVNEQRAVSRAVSNSTSVSTVPDSARGASLWASRPRGGSTTPHVFIGNGSRSTGRLFVGLRFYEVPPGSAGIAWASSIVALVITATLVPWSLTHEPSDSVSGSALIAALIAIASGVLDNSTPRRAIVNSPLLPRLMLYSQTLVMISLALWLQVRGTVSTSLPLSSLTLPVEVENIAALTAVALTAADTYIGWAILALQLIIVAILSGRSWSSLANFNKIFGSRGSPSFRMSDRAMQSVLSSKRSARE